MNDDLEPEIRKFHQEINEDYARRGASPQLSLSDRRAVAEEVRRPWAKGGPVMEKTRDLQVGDRQVHIRIYEPKNTCARAALIYVHGGGWTMFSLDTHDRLMREYAARTGVAVVGIDYSLSPEVRFPHALEEIESVISWLREGNEPSIDPHRLAIAGDSAGANMALATSLRLRDAGKRALSAMVLNYGAFDWKFRGSYERYGSEAYMLTASEMEDFWRNYLLEKDRDDPHARVAVANYTGLPPTYLCIAECDILADENYEVAERLAADGVAVRVKVYQGATHSFLESVAISPLAGKAFSDASTWLRPFLVDASAS